MEVARVLALIVMATWLSWTLYRHVGIYLARGRVLAVTAATLDRILILAGLVTALAASSPPRWIVAGGLASLGLLVHATQTWIVIGATIERILERAGLILRGMGLSSETTGRSLEGAEGRLRIIVAGSVGRRAHLLRVRSARGIKKLDLFRANLRKFLLAIARRESR